MRVRCGGFDKVSTSAKLAPIIMMTQGVLSTFTSNVKSATTTTTPPEIAFIGSLAGSDSACVGYMIAKGGGGSIIVPVPLSPHATPLASVTEDVNAFALNAARTVSESWLIAPFNDSNANSKLTYQLNWKPDVLHVEVWSCEPSSNDTAPPVLKSCVLSSVVNGDVVSKIGCESVRCERVISVIVCLQMSVEGRHVMESRCDDVIVTYAVSLSQQIKPKLQLNTMVSVVDSYVHLVLLIVELYW